MAEGTIGHKSRAGHKTNETVNGKWLTPVLMLMCACDAAYGRGRVWICDSVCVILCIALRCVQATLLHQVYCAFRGNCQAVKIRTDIDGSVIVWLLPQLNGVPLFTFH